jgi:tRNA G18 (ribose-2'-O)-methylase SpoU
MFNQERKSMARKSNGRMPRGYFGIGVYHAKSECNIGTLMRSAHCFGASFVYTIGRRYYRQASDTTNAAANIPLYHFGDLQGLIDHLPVGCPLVGVELTDDAEKVGNTFHPKQCCYLLGAEDHGLPQSVLERCHRVFVVPHAIQCLNVAVAGSIVLFDRACDTANRRVSQRGLVSA